MRKINILLLSLTVLSLMNVNYYKNNDNKQLEETTNDTNLVEARKLNDLTSNEEIKISISHDGEYAVASVLIW